MTVISDYSGRSARDNVIAAISTAREHAEFNAVLSYAEERALAIADKVDAG